MAKKNKNPGGRPTGWKPEYNERIVEFFDIKAVEEVEVMSVTKEGNVSKIKKERPNALPTFEKFAADIGVHVDTLTEWAKPINEKKYPGFSVAYRKAKHFQQNILVTNGLLGHYQANFAIFVATNFTDMKHTSHQRVAGEDGGPIETKITGINYIVPKPPDGAHS